MLSAKKWHVGSGGLSKASIVLHKDHEWDFQVTHPMSLPRIWSASYNLQRHTSGWILSSGFGLHTDYYQKVVSGLLTWWSSQFIVWIWTWWTLQFMFPPWSTLYPWNNLEPNSYILIVTVASWSDTLACECIQHPDSVHGCIWTLDSTIHAFFKNVNSIFDTKKPKTHISKCICRCSWTLRSGVFGFHGPGGN